MTVILLRSTMLAIALLTLGHCKSSTPPSSTQSLERADVEAILNDAKEAFDKGVDKHFMFLVSEDRLTDQGESFFEDYRLLLNNHIGNNYQIHVLTSGDPRWTYKLQSEGTFKVHVERQVGINGLKSYIKRFSDQMRASRQADGKKVQVILNLLAHGLSSTGTGEGFVKFAEADLSFRDIAQTIVDPIASSVDEFIGIIEPCFGGNLALNLAQNFFVANNAMLIVGAPPWASQWAPSNEQAQQINGPEFTRSTATLALKRALMGFASDLSDETPVTFGDGHTLEIFRGTDAATKLQERHIVRVNEFIPYVEQRDTLINCNFARNMRRESIARICATGNMDDMKMGTGLWDEGNMVKGAIQDFIASSNGQASKDEFKSFMRQKFPVHPLKVFTTKQTGVTLNPNNQNGILSVININVLDAAGGTFAGAEREDTAAVSQSLQQCLAGIEAQNEDLLEVVNWVLNKGPDTTSANVGYPSLPPPPPSSNPGFAPNRPDLNERGGYQGAYSYAGNQTNGPATSDSKPHVCGKYASVNSYH